jgi:hypothetical protein
VAVPAVVAVSPAVAAAAASRVVAGFLVEGFPVEFPAAGSLGVAEAPAVEGP